MSQEYLNIFTDITEDEPDSVSLPPLPNLDSYDAETKITVLFKLYKRAAFKKDRVLSLLYMFYLGKWIFSYNLSLKGTGLTPYYFLVAKRAYLLFESDEVQIMRTKLMTVKDLKKLSKKEFQCLLN